MGNVTSSCVTMVLILTLGTMEAGSLGKDNGLINLKLEPEEAVISAGDNATFKCSYPQRAKFFWEFSADIRSDKYTISKGLSNNTGHALYWSEFTLYFAKRRMTGEISCSVNKTPETAVAFLVVNGLPVGSFCRSTDDCITKGAICHHNICSCRKDEVLLRLSSTGYETCQRMIYNLYDPCEFAEQCSTLVDPHSTCGSNGVCVCSRWAIEKSGECMLRENLPHEKNQELYRIGLVAITCLIVVIVVASLWITMKKSCRDDHPTINRRRRNGHSAESGANEEETISITDDRPPSYSDVLEKENTVTSPPAFFEALKYSVTAKKLRRQVSAPAGQLLNRTTSFCAQPDVIPSGSNRNIIAQYVEETDNWKRY